jgi:hypothetical protein
MGALSLLRAMHSAAAGSRSHVRPTCSAIRSSAANFSTPAIPAPLCRQRPSRQAWQSPTMPSGRLALLNNLSGTRTGLQIVRIEPQSVSDRIEVGVKLLASRMVPAA